MLLSSSFQTLLLQLSPAFTKPTCRVFALLVCGAVMARVRTVTGMILGADATRLRHHSVFHRFFASAAWSLDTLGLMVFSLVEPYCDKDQILLAGDDTLARKRGLKIFGVGMHHDPLLSTRRTAVMNWGHSWVVLAVIVRFPFRPDHAYALPVLFRMYRSKQTVAREGGTYLTKPQLMLQMLDTLCSHRKDRRFHLVADSAYGGKSVLCHLPVNCDLTSRLHLDARLHAPVDRSAKNPRGGRPRKRGRRLPTPRQMLAGRCRRLTINLYGRRDRSRVAEGVAHHYHTPDRLLRVVAIEPINSGRGRQAFYSTCDKAGAEQVLGWYAMRWSIEVTNHDAKGSLGFEQPQSWSRRAALRTAPTMMLIYSLVVLWFAEHGHRTCKPLHRPWYIGKWHASFAEMLGELRCRSTQEDLQRQGHRSLASQPTALLLHHLKLAA